MALSGLDPSKEARVRVTRKAHRYPWRAGVGWWFKVDNISLSRIQSAIYNRRNKTGEIWKIAHRDGVRIFAENSRVYVVRVK